MFAVYLKGPNALLTFEGLIENFQTSELGDFDRQYQLIGGHSYEVVVLPVVEIFPDTKSFLDEIKRRRREEVLRRLDLSSSDRAVLDL